jgi:hypothetical protein
MFDKETEIDFPFLEGGLNDLFGDPYHSDFAKSFMRHIDLTEFADVLEGVTGYLDREDGKITFYGNYVLAGPIRKALRFIRERGLADELITWDGCYNLRPKKGGKGSTSVHGWGLAIDLNAATNPYNEKRLITDMPPEFIQCFLDAGFEWGGSWDSPHDAMHFQLAWTRLKRARFQPKPYTAEVETPEIATVPVSPIPESAIETLSWLAKLAGGQSYGKGW